MYCTVADNIVLLCREQKAGLSAFHSLFLQLKMKGTLCDAIGLNLCEI